MERRVEPELGAREKDVLRRHSFRVYQVVRQAQELAKEAGV